MSSQLPFNTKAKLTPAPSEYGVGFKVYTMADRMYSCDPANIQKINKTALNFERQWFTGFKVMAWREEDFCARESLWLCSYGSDAYCTAACCS